ncbi:GntR family transcriptional regulator [Dethiosulfatibacter aminovorans DSM 17477]|uniref:GntR family transcriptional regulator n=1 Tax=Dethiosulfatibacter aminovorans DSM 17477 TaxID=1121476 RepID=A0A1M6B053_9FIRM|nr:GntR family transcriptional regulator [Dethiosulfatibacter aminovorans]SHI41948.1 GntR family transcriptional regulator [Dethiosulfatibacter aminovorans DSM 17477]
MAVWMEILDDIIEGITSGEYSKMEKLPSENVLADQYNTTRYNVRKAFERLYDMGYLSAQKGKGRYFKSKGERIMLRFEEEDSFTNKMKRTGHNLVNKNINFQEMENVPRIRKKLNLPEDFKVYRLQLLRIIDDEPAAIHISYLSDRKFPDIEREGVAIESLYNYYRSKGIDQVNHIRSHMQTMLPTNFERSMLECPNLVPVLSIESLVEEKRTGEIIEYSKTIYRGDRFYFSIY